MGFEVDNTVVVNVEIDGHDSLVKVDAPDSLRSKLSYSCDVRVGKRVSFKLFIRMDDGDEVKEEGDEDSGGFEKQAKSTEHDSGSSDCSKGFNVDEESGKSCPENRSGEADSKVPFDETTNSKPKDEEDGYVGGGGGSGNGDECRNFPSDCNDFEGSYGNLDDHKKADDCFKEEEMSDETKDTKPTCNDDNQENFRPGSCPYPGEIPKEADDFVKGETFAEDDKSVPECNDSTFKHEKSQDESFSWFDWDNNNDDDQFDYMRSCSFDDERDAVFLSDFRNCNGDDSGCEFACTKKNDECGNDASDRNGFEGSYANLDEKSGSKPCPKSQYGQEDTKVPSSSWQYSGENTKKADDFFGEEETFVEDHKSVPDFKHEQSHDEPFLRSDREDADDQYEYKSYDIISERERMKETDGFKRADEAEWAARQQEILNQAEEARTLRKRRKLEMSEAEKKAQEKERQLKRKQAEQLRAANLQKRQKQRVQEIKESEKKDKADSNAKDRYRTAARQWISLLESKCKDLPSLLHALGFVGSKPSPVEVRQACKKAMLKYHPDHTSKAGIQQQVQAEELFKLIRQMNEKYVKGR
ncbi:hypothetical protein LINPERHAP2_LOCUS18681 [Linum perenne]